MVFIDNKPLASESFGKAFLLAEHETELGLFAERPNSSSSQGLTVFRCFIERLYCSLGLALKALGFSARAFARLPVRSPHDRRIRPSTKILGMPD
jgi:hypothetical protein